MTLLLSTLGGIDGTGKMCWNLKMAEQSLAAIDEADVVLVYGRWPCWSTPSDVAIAKHLRQLEKPSMLVVNKVDGIDPDAASADFALGVEDMYQIAAAHGRGVTALIDLALNPFAEALKAENGEASDLTEFEDEEEERWFHWRRSGKKNLCCLQDQPIKLAIIGRPNVGKSTLPTVFLGEERAVVYDMPGTTRDSIYIPMQRDEREYVLDWYCGCSSS